jgi:hypothetical protein
MTEIATTCRQCNESWTPDHQDYVRGQWRTCPDCRDLAARLEQLRQAPPAPLPRHRDRDGPTKDQQPIPAPKRGTGAHGNAQSHSWNWRSKGT